MFYGSRTSCFICTEPGWLYLLMYICMYAHMHVYICTFTTLVWLKAPHFFFGSGCIACLSPVEFKLYLPGHWLFRNEPAGAQNLCPRLPSSGTPLNSPVDLGRRTEDPSLARALFHWTDSSCWLWGYWITTHHFLCSIIKYPHRRVLRLGSSTAITISSTWLRPFRITPGERIKFWKTSVKFCDIENEAYVRWAQQYK